MTTSTLDIIAHASDSDDGRTRRLYHELQHALSQVRSADLRRWGVATAGRIPVGLWRRCHHLGNMLVTAGRHAAREVRAGAAAATQNELRAHLSERAKATRAVTGRSAKAVATAARRYAELVPRLRTEPEVAAPLLFGSLLGFLVGSGGLDAEGGIADVDLLIAGGPGSAVSHSLIGGAFSEALILGGLQLVLLVHEKLPHNRDPLWDRLAMMATRGGLSMCLGASAGLSYHIGAHAVAAGNPFVATQAAAEVTSWRDKEGQ